jgi:hypothetical protein
MLSDLLHSAPQSIARVRIKKREEHLFIGGYWWLFSLYKPGPDFDVFTESKWQGFRKIKTK